jgi:hypothetical protein
MIDVTYHKGTAKSILYILCITGTLTDGRSNERSGYGERVSLSGALNDALNIVSMTELNLKYQGPKIRDLEVAHFFEMGWISFASCDSTLVFAVPSTRAA